ncbi:MAG: adenylate/guanylate cyclase domain-containing protein [Actinobacteria bacterium]|nr:adenylate/guanylate cyclase domain-containing protein [Actinomycetota bacterium]
MSLAFQVVGDGAVDLVFCQGFVSNVDLWWEMPAAARLMLRLASFSRLILWDKRGTGLSDPVERPPTMDERVNDLQAVMDAAGADHAAILGISEGGPMSLNFALRHPERTTALILYGSFPRFTAAPDWPCGLSRARIDELLEEIDTRWGEGAMADLFAPSYSGDERFRQVWGRFLRAGASPSMGRALFEALDDVDCRAILPEIRVPTLVLHRTGDRIASVEGARYMAGQIPGCRFVELAGDDHIYTVGDSDAVIDEVEEFLTGVRHAVVTDRVVTTVMFTDIVGSTSQAAGLGDVRWRDLVTEHDAAVRGELERFGGVEVKTMGDGFLAHFPSPSRAIECAVALHDTLRHRLGLELRVALHTGECDRVDSDLLGVAVAVAARLLGMAGGGEVLVSDTVRGLVVGQPFTFTDRGVHELKGVPGQWSVFAVSR